MWLITVHVHTNTYLSLTLFSNNHQPNYMQHVYDSNNYCIALVTQFSLMYVAAYRGLAYGFKILHTMLTLSGNEGSV